MGKTTKICTKCRREKVIGEFGNPYFRVSNQKYYDQTICLECRRTKARNKARQVKRVIVHEFQNKCFDCGKEYPDCVFDFHHVDGGTKDTEVSRLKMSDIHLLQNELNKCVMLCANCHRIRHWKLES